MKGENFCIFGKTLVKLVDVTSLYANCFCFCNNSRRSSSRIRRAREEKKRKEERKTKTTDRKKEYIKSTHVYSTMGVGE